MGGTVLGPEILYTQDFEAEALFPSLVASMVAFAIFGAYVGYVPLFGSHENLGFHPGQIGYYLIIGVLGGVLGRGYATGFYGTHSALGRLALPSWVKPALAGLAVGALGLAMPQVLGTGYGWVQRSMGLGLLAIPLWIVLLVPLARIGATAFSIGSGGSGGIFGPGMVIGAFIGGAVWRVAYDLGLAVPHTPAPFVIVGMVACFGSISHAPIAVLLMVTEMTGSLHLMLASLIGLAVAVAIAGRQYIYRAQLVDRAASPAHRLDSAGSGTATVSVGDIMRPARLMLDAASATGDALGKLRHLGLPGAPVVDAEGRYCGVVSVQSLEGPGGEMASGSLGQIAGRGAKTGLAPSLGLDLAMEEVSQGNLGWAPVLDNCSVVIGIVSSDDLVRGYKLALARDSLPLSEDEGETLAVDMEVEQGSSMAGETIGRLTLPQGTLVLSLKRGGQSILPAAGTTIVAGDCLSFLTRADQVVALRRRLAASPDQASSGAGRGLSAGGLI